MTSLAVLKNWKYFKSQAIYNAVDKALIEFYNKPKPIVKPIPSFHNRNYPIFQTVRLILRLLQVSNFLI